MRKLSKKALNYVLLTLERTTVSLTLDDGRSKTTEAGRTIPSLMTSQQKMSLFSPTIRSLKTKKSRKLRRKRQQDSLS